MWDAEGGKTGGGNRWGGDVECVRHTVGVAAAGCASSPATVALPDVGPRVPVEIRTGDQGPGGRHTWHSI